MKTKTKHRLKDDLISYDKLELWIKNKYNVLFRGRHGVGKTHIILKAFKRAGLRYAYFSAATLDPWIDFSGIPITVVDPKSGKTEIHLQRPQHLIDVNPQAIFFDEYNRCLVGNTPIPLANGKVVPIKSLVAKKEFFLYSKDLKGDIVIARGHSACKTGTRKIVAVTLDSGEEVKCTGDHKFLLRSGKYKMAEDLVLGDSLMPFYTRLSPGEDKIPAGYFQIWQPDKKKWEYAHHLADKYNLEHGVYPSSRGRVRHHKDFNKLNNTPSNIQRLGWSEHLTYHQDTGSSGGKATHKKYPDHCANSFHQAKARKKAIKRSTKTRATSIAYKKLRSKITKQHFTVEERKKQQQRCLKSWRKGNFDAIDRTAALRKNWLKRTLRFASGIKNLTKRRYIKKIESTTGKGSPAFGIKRLLKEFKTFDNFISAVEQYKATPEYKFYNHKVISVRPCGKEDVYDLTVDKYHNFAIGQGIIVHNSHKKIRNAVMELMQFKTINGQPMGDDLQMIWAAVNPDDDEGEYDVDRIDPAQEDRFHIQVDIPYKCSASYFERKYGEEGKTAVKFWNKLEEPIRLLVSPRRLDYVMKVWAQGGDIRDALPVAANPSRLLQLINGEGYQDLDPLLKDYDEAETFFRNENNYAMYISDVLKKRKYWQLLDAMPDEKIVTLLTKQSRKVAGPVKRHIQREFEKKSKDSIAIYRPILNEIIQANSNYPVMNWAKDMIQIIDPDEVDSKKQAKTKVSPMGIGIKGWIADLFSHAQNTGQPVTVGDLQAHIKKHMGRNPRVYTITVRVTRFKKWFDKKHGLKVIPHSTTPGKESWMIQ